MIPGVMSLTPSFSFINDCGPGNQAEVNVCEVLKADITSLASKSSYCSKGAPQKGKSEHCSNVKLYVMTDAYGSLSFSTIFSASLLLTLLHSGAIPLVVVKTTGLNEDFSMSITLWLHLPFSFSCCW